MVLLGCFSISRRLFSFWLFPVVLSNSKPQPSGVSDCHSQSSVLVRARGPSAREDGPALFAPRSLQPPRACAGQARWDAPT